MNITNQIWTFSSHFLEKKKAKGSFCFGIFFLEGVRIGRGIWLCCDEKGKNLGNFPIFLGKNGPNSKAGGIYANPS